MLEFNNKVEVKRPITEVFQFLSNFENMPKWNYFVVNVSWFEKHEGRMEFFQLGSSETIEGLQSITAKCSQN